MDSPVPYRLVERLGEGAMGEVWKAWDERLCRHVAIKFLATRLLAEDDARQRFRREVLAASALNHPNILTVFDCGEHQGRPYLVSELIEGSDLRDRMSRGPIPLRQVLEWTRQVLFALETAHAAGILHRDLKPENLIVRHDDYIKIVDFGLAKFTDEQSSGLSGDQVVGTLDYMAPEQLQGQALDGRVDLYALGAVVFEMVSGQRPFQGKSLTEIVTAILTRDPLLPGGPMREWLRRALEKDPARRFPSAAAMRQALPFPSDGDVAAAAPAPPREEALLVLPVASSDEDRELADGLFEGLIAQLSRVKGVRVIARSTAERFRGAEAREAGARLGAAWVLEGTLRGSASRMRLNVAVTETQGGFQVWSERFDSERKDLSTSKTS